MSFTLLTVLLVLLAGSTDESEKRVLRISGGEFPSVFEAAERNESGYPTRFRGFGLDHIDWISQLYNYDPVFVRIRLGSSAVNNGIFVNGSWNGIIGDLVSNQADLGLSAIGSRETYIPYVDQTHTFAAQSSFSMFIPYPERTGNVWSFLEPFDKLTWICLLASLICVGTVMWLVLRFSNFRNDENHRHPRYETVMLYLITVLTSQGGNWNYKAKGAVFLAMFWCLMSVVLVNAYNGLLISELTTTKPKPLVTSLADLAADPSIKFYTFSNSQYAFMLLSAQEGKEKVIGDILRKNPDRFLKTPADCIAKVEEGPYVCFYSTNTGDRVANQRLKATGKCQITRVGEPLANNNPVFVVRKDSPFFEPINQGVLLATSYGLGFHWHYRNQPRAECRLNLGSTTNKTKLSLANFSGAFLILLIGIILAGISFLAEITWYRLDMKKNRSQKQ